MTKLFVSGTKDGPIRGDRKALLGSSGLGKILNYFNVFFRPSLVLPFAELVVACRVLLIINAPAWRKKWILKVIASS